MAHGNEDPSPTASVGSASERPSNPSNPGHGWYSTVCECVVCQAQTRYEVDRETGEARRILVRPAQRNVTVRPERYETYAGIERSVTPLTGRIPPGPPWTESAPPPMPSVGPGDLMPQGLPGAIHARDQAPDGGMLTQVQQDLVTQYAREIANELLAQYGAGYKDGGFLGLCGCLDRATAQVYQRLGVPPTNQTDAGFCMGIAHRRVRAELNKHQPVGGGFGAGFWWPLDMDHVETRRRVVLDVIQVSGGLWEGPKSAAEDRILSRAEDRILQAERQAFHESLNRRR